MIADEAKFRKGKERELFESEVASSLMKYLEKMPDSIKNGQ